MDIYFPPDQGAIQPATTMLVASRSSKEKIIGECQVVERQVAGGGFSGVASFGITAQGYLDKYDGKSISERAIKTGKIAIKVTIAAQPKHGRLVKRENDPYGTWNYYPNEAYLGKDKVEALVSVGDDVVRVVYNFVVQPKVVDQLTDTQYRKFCSRNAWKISSNLPTSTGDFSNWHTTTSLNALLANASYSLTGFSDLTGSAVAKQRREL